jgi:hypothetical protein
MQKTASIVKEVCLLIGCLAMYVLLLGALARAGMCLPNCCQAVGMHVTIHCHTRRKGLKRVLTAYFYMNF